MAFDEYGYICPYNDWCRCQIADCDFCGWNPIVAERRLEELRKSLGVEKEKLQHRYIDAIDLVAKMNIQMEPLVRKKSTPRAIYAAAMKCVAAMPTIEEEQITCDRCRFAKYMEKTGVWKCQNRTGLFREVQPEEYCSKGKERCEDGN